MNTFGHSIITRIVDLVTAHELGHNFGAEHDPDTEECAPTARDGGAYIMYTFSVSGYDTNNKFFSPCSKRAIQNVLRHKARSCFTRVARAFCGNGIIEEGEDCDAGQIGQKDRDPCCDIECRFKPLADCCDLNSPCCQACRIVPAGIVCTEENELTCRKEAYCNGWSPECPSPSPVPNGQDCLDRGKCKDGNCLTFCETIGMTACMCDNTRDACKRCCRRKNYPNATCEAVFPGEELTDGTPCVHGFCEKGRCEKAVQDPIQRFWDVIEEVNARVFVKALKDNIVGVIAILLAILWFPASIFISKYDQKVKQKILAQIEERRTLMGTSREATQSASIGGGGAVNMIPMYRSQRQSGSSERSVGSGSVLKPLLEKPKAKVRTNFGMRVPRNPANRETNIVRAGPRPAGQNNGSTITLGSFVAGVGGGAGSAYGGDNGSFSPHLSPSNVPFALPPIKTPHHEDRLKAITEYTSQSDEDEGGFSRNHHQPTVREPFLQRHPRQSQSSADSEPIRSSSYQTKFGINMQPHAYRLSSVGHEFPPQDELDDKQQKLNFLRSASGTGRISATTFTNNANSVYTTANNGHPQFTGVSQHPNSSATTTNAQNLPAANDTVDVNLNHDNLHQLQVHYHNNQQQTPMPTSNVDTSITNNISAACDNSTMDEHDGPSPVFDSDVDDNAFETGSEARSSGRSLRI